jgi:hypothetical protein
MNTVIENQKYNNFLGGGISPQTSYFLYKSLACWGSGTGPGKNSGDPIERDLIEWKIMFRSLLWFK